MAVVDKKQTLPLLTGGMNLNDPSNGIGWIQNLNHYQNAWETRDGFGVVGVYDTQMLVKSMPPFADANKGDINIGFIEICGVYSFITDFNHQQQIVIVKTKGNNSVLSHHYPEWQVLPEASAGLQTTFYTAIIHDITTNEYLEEPLYIKTTERQTLREIAEYPTSPTPRDLIGSAVNVGNQHGAQESSAYPYNVYANLKEATTNPIQPTREYELTKIPPCFFAQFGDNVYFGNEEIGVHYYIPTIFTAERLKRVENYSNKDLLTGYSETSVIKKVVFGDTTDNVSLDQGFVFFRNSEVPSIIDLCVWNERLVYLTSDRRILYSNFDEPYAIIAENFDVITSEYSPTGLAEVSGRLVVFTERETIILQPVDNQILASGGRQIKVSSTIGCVSASSKIRQEGVLFWADYNGLYVSSGGGEITTLSEPAIDKFFKDYITNPMTNYYSTNGWTTLSNAEQPRLDYGFNNLGLHMVYDNVNRHIVWNFTQLRIAIIFNIDTKEFYLWNFQSVVDTQVIEVEEGEDITIPAVGAKNNLGYFWLSSVPNDRLLGVFVEKQEILDATKTFEDYTTYPTGNPTSGAYFGHSIVFTEYGRGGSLDRSQDLIEERRKITSGYVSLFTEISATATSPCTFFFEKGYWQQSPFLTPEGQSYETGDPSLSDAIYWLPISIQLEDYATFGQVEPPNVIYCTFRFDNEHWKPVFNPDLLADAQIDFDLPTERTQLTRAFGTPTPVAGVAECACYNPLTNLPSVNGSEIRIAVNPFASMPVNSYRWHPAINLIQYWKNPFVLLPFRKKITGAGNTTINNSFSLGITPAVVPSPVYGAPTGFQVIRDDNAGGSREDDYSMTGTAYVWMETYTYPNLKGGILGTETAGGGGNREASKFGLGRFQPIDWLYKSAEIGDGKVGLKPRGTIAQMSSRGKASAEPPIQWDLGVYNILVSTNFKQYQGQLLDYESTLPAGLTTKSNTPANNITKTKDTNITSIYQVSSEDVIPKTFEYRGLNVDQNIVLGDPTDATKGNYLIDGQIFVNKVTSDGTRGERFTYTLFGHLRNRAEKLYIKSVDAIYRVIGSVRRTGR